MYKFLLTKDKNDLNHAILTINESGKSIEEIVGSNKYYYYTIVLSSKFSKKDLKNIHKINLSINFNGECALTTNLHLVDNFDAVIKKMKLVKGFLDKKKSFTSLHKLIKKYQSFIVFV